MIKTKWWNGPDTCTYIKHEICNTILIIKLVETGVTE
jgi:hypothetical protein